MKSIVCRLFSLNEIEISAFGDVPADRSFLICRHPLQDVPTGVE